MLNLSGTLITLPPTRFTVKTFKFDDLTI